MRYRLILVIAVFFALGAYLAAMWINFGGPGIPDVMAVPGTKARVGAPFVLTDHTGKLVSNAYFRGRHMLVFFGYTHSPDIGPSGLRTIAATLDRLGPRADRVAAIFISLDPDRDTPAILANYLTGIDARLIGLTGTEQEIAALAKAYHVYYAKALESPAGDDYLIDHSSLYYLMDQKGAYAAHFAFGLEPDEIARRIALLL